MKNRISSEKNIIVTLRHLLKELPVLDIEFDVCDGNPLGFYYFMTFLDEVVENRIGEQRGRLARLLKYTSGNAKEMIKSCVWEPPTYQHAKKILLEKYGNPYHVIV